MTDEGGRAALGKYLTALGLTGATGLSFGMGVGEADAGTLGGMSKIAQWVSRHPDGPNPFVNDRLATRIHKRAYEMHSKGKGTALGLTGATGLAFGAGYSEPADAGALGGLSKVVNTIDDLISSKQVGQNLKIETEFKTATARTWRIK